MPKQLFVIILTLLGLFGVAQAAEKQAPAPVVEQVRYTPEVVAQKRAGLERAQELVRGHQREWCAKEKECVAKYDELLAAGESLIARLPKITTAKFGEELQEVMQLAEKVELTFDPARKQAAK